MLRSRLNTSGLPASSGRTLSVKNLSFCFLSAFLLLLSFPPFNLEWCVWIAFLPFFKALERGGKRDALILGYATGFVFWAGLIYWLVHVTLLGTLVLISYLALFFAAFGLAVSIFDRLRNWRFLLFPAAWVLLEHLRSYLFTGFPWALLGYSQYLNLPIIQIAAFTGAWGLSFLVMVVNGAVYSFVDDYSRRRRLGSAAFQLIPAAMCLLLTFVYGYSTLHHRPSTIDLQSFRISVIQGNIPQDMKWAPDARYKIVDRYKELSLSAAQGTPDLIVWPEAASPVFLGEDDSLFSEIFSIARGCGTPLLIGSVVREDERYYNSALLIDARGLLVSRYDKLHLVPFGEYIPLRKILPFLETIAPIGDIERGKDYTIFKLPTLHPKAHVRFSVLVCFEDLFPELSAHFVRRGAHFLINITNDAWYKRSAAASQHLQASVLRAVENRRFLVRSANTGISVFISPEGRQYSLVKDRSEDPLFVTGYATADLSLTPAVLSFYTRFPDLVIILCAVALFCAIIRLFKNN